jgi:hypothetical protein
VYGVVQATLNELIVPEVELAAAYSLLIVLNLGDQFILGVVVSLIVVLIPLLVLVRPNIVDMLSVVARKLLFVHTLLPTLVVLWVEDSPHVESGDLVLNAVELPNRLFSRVKVFEVLNSVLDLRVVSTTLVQHPGFDVNQCLVQVLQLLVSLRQLL